MITLTVVAFNDSPADGTLRVRLDELGGSIGRAETNQLVLPDPERVVSRVAAQVVYRNGVFAIVDRGSNPVVLNGRPLVSGRESPLSPGDRLRICGYEMKVELESAATVVDNDPFSSLLGPAVKSSSGASVIDPLLQPRPAARPAATAPSSAPAASAIGIPADWDPFGADLPKAGQAAAPARPQRDALGLDLGAAAPAALVPGMDAPPPSTSSLDQLFGLGPSTGSDPFAASMLEAPIAQPNMAADADPLRSLKSAPKASGASESDQLSDLNRPFSPPPGIRAAQPVRPAPPQVPTPAQRPASAAVGPPAARVPAPRPVAPPTPVPPLAASSMAAPSMVAPPARPAAAAPVAPSAPLRVEAPHDSTVLLDALRRGLDVPALELPALTPALMEVIGQMLREAVGGTMAQLRARPPAKPGLRAGAAAMQAQGSNPLKFAPDAGVALRHLLAPPARGALAAGPAVRDAQEELRAQQIALVAAAQSALEGALGRLEPAAIEAESVARPSPLSLLPASRNARLWEAFTANYVGIRQGAINDFRAQFTRAFMEACDEQLKRSAVRTRERPEIER